MLNVSKPQKLWSLPLRFCIKKKITNKWRKFVSKTFSGQWKKLSNMPSSNGLISNIVLMPSVWYNALTVRKCGPLHYLMCVLKRLVVRHTTLSWRYTTTHLRAALTTVFQKHIWSPSPFIGISAFSCCFKDTACDKCRVASSKGFKSQRGKVWIFHLAFTKCTETGKGAREHAPVLMVTK